MNKRCFPLGGGSCFGPRWPDCRGSPGSLMELNHQLVHMCLAAVTSPNDWRDSGPIVKTDARTVSIGFAAYLYSAQMQIE